MGRCYEFGVVIAEGCDHVMVVPAEGGKCVCSGCGTECLGRFNGCASIISQPGYVPLLAPKPSAASRARAAPALRPIAEPAPAHAHVEQAHPIPAPPPPPPPSVVPLFTDKQVERLLSAPEEVLDKMQVLGEHLRERDNELAAAFDRFAEVLHRLSAEAAADRKAQEKLAEAIQELVTRVDSVEATVTRPIIKFRRSS